MADEQGIYPLYGRLQSDFALETVSTLKDDQM